MAASKRPTERRASRCTPVTARATLIFEIVGYSLHKGMGIGKFIRSTTVSVGRYEWCIRYYPDGESEESQGHVSVYLELLSKGAKVRVLYDLRLVNQASGLSSPVKSCSKSPRVFNSLDTSGTDDYYIWGAPSFKKKSELEESAYLRDDRLVIECDLTVIMEPLVANAAVIAEVQMPPSDLAENFGKLLEAAEEADVTFEVEGEIFPAHKIVLATRFLVFKAELYGPMRGKCGQNITVEDMPPAVFKALLHFIYTDALPSIDKLNDEEKKEMVRHLLVAADRYAMERMKMMCEDILCKTLEVETVATTSALADQYHCCRLKDACAEFIMSSNRMDDVLASQGESEIPETDPRRRLLSPAAAASRGRIPPRAPRFLVRAACSPALSRRASSPSSSAKSSPTLTIRPPPRSESAPLRKLVAEPVEVPWLVTVERWERRLPLANGELRGEQQQRDGIPGARAQWWRGDAAEALAGVGKVVARGARAGGGGEETRGQELRMEMGGAPWCGRGRAAAASSSPGSRRLFNGSAPAASAPVGAAPACAPVVASRSSRWRRRGSSSREQGTWELSRFGDHGRRYRLECRHRAGPCWRFWKCSR